MVQKMIPCFFMRGGTSRGLYFLKEHLPIGRDTLNKLLLAVMGSPDSRQIDGLGGGTSTTSKVAIISKSEERGVDVDYQFAQVSVTNASVDWDPSCGNILAGVGPAAIEMGLIDEVGESETMVKIRALNNGSLVEAFVRTPDKQVTYEGVTAISGVPGTGAPIKLNFLDIVGSKTKGKLLPTGNVRDNINGVDVTLIDCAMPIVIAQASAMGKTGYETKAELENDAAFFKRLEEIRCIAGEMMGLGNVAGRVIPKFAIVARPANGGNITARYFVPTAPHASMAVTGGISISACSVVEGTVAHAVAEFPEGPNDREENESTDQHERKVVIEHPSGKLEVVVTYETRDRKVHIRSAGVIRTARLLFMGLVRVPEIGHVEEPEEVHEVHSHICQLYHAKHQESVGNKYNPSPITSPRTGPNLARVRSMTSRGITTSAICTTSSPVSQLLRGVSTKNSIVQPSTPKPNAIQLAMVPAESVISSLGSALMSFCGFSSTSMRTKNLANSKADETYKVKPTPP